MSPARPAALLICLGAGVALAAGFAQARASARVPEHLDARFHHDRSYPDRGAVVAQLPSARYAASFEGRRYYDSGGVWYQRRGARFVVVEPPAGLYVPHLPPYCTTLWVGGVPYFYANDVFYVYRGSLRGYEIVAPPSDARAPRAGRASTPPPPESGQLFVYPDRGQSRAREASDKRQCHEWASSETGFDPLAAGTSGAGAAPKRADYDRAMEACLEGRGYSLR